MNPQIVDGLLLVIINNRARSFKDLIKRNCRTMVDNDIWFEHKDCYWMILE